MKSRIQGLVAGILVGVVLTSGSAFAKQVSEAAQLYYNNIKIYIDGAEIVPKDANGNPVEPFAMNGTTYLPVRAVANAFGKDVEWDGATQSVYIGKKDQTKPDTYLDRIQYTNFEKTDNGANTLYKINGTVTDYLGTTYTNGMLFYTYTHSIWQMPNCIEDDKDEAQIIIDYPLNSQYSTLSGKVVLPKTIDSTSFDSDDQHNGGSHEVDVYLYGDGKLIKKVASVTPTMPFSFEVSVRGVNNLTIKAKEHFCSGTVSTFIALTDLALYK